MYLMYTGGRQYANAVRRRRSKGSGYETIYLGKVLDRVRGIYENRLLPTRHPHRLYPRENPLLLVGEDPRVPEKRRLYLDLHGPRHQTA